MIDIFSILVPKVEIYRQSRFQKLNLQNNWFFSKRVIYIFGTDCLLKSKKAIQKKIKIKFDDFRNNGQEKNLRGHFWEL